MLSSGAFAAVTVLVAVIGVFVLLVSKNWGPSNWKPSPPDPAVAPLVGAVEDAVGALAGSLNQALPRALARAGAGIQQIPAGVADSWGPTNPAKSCFGFPGCEGAQRCSASSPPMCQQQAQPPASWAGDLSRLQKAQKAVADGMSAAQTDFRPVAEAANNWTGGTPVNFFLDQQDNVNQLYSSVQKLASAAAAASDQLGQIHDEWGVALQNAGVADVPASMKTALDSVKGAQGALTALGGATRTAGGGALMAQYAALASAYQRLIRHFLMPSGLSPPGFGPPGGR